MNIIQLKKLLGLMTSLSFATIIQLEAATKVIHMAQPTSSMTVEHKQPSPFEQKEWKKNAEALSNLMKMNPDKLAGIKAMYVAKIKAADFLIHQKTRSANITPEQTIDQRTAALLSPVEKFLPEVKALRKRIIPLIKISLDRTPTDAEKELDPDMQKHLTFQSSLFKRALGSTEEINSFIKTHIKKEEDFTQLCEEFHRVFGDLLNHAFTDSKHEFEKLIEKAKNLKQKTVTPAA